MAVIRSVIATMTTAGAEDAQTGTVAAAAAPVAGAEAPAPGHGPPRGERYSPDTIQSVLTLRDFMDTMRSSGNVGGGPPPLTHADRNAFAGHLDTWLARRNGAA